MIKTREGGRSTLVVRHGLTRPRDQRGLGFIDFKTRAQALLSKWISKTLEDLSMEWASLFMVLSSNFTWEQYKVVNWAQYTSQDKILLGNVQMCMSMPYTMGIWQAWEELRRYLFLSPVGNSIPAHWWLDYILNHLPLLQICKKEFSKTSPTY